MPINAARSQPFTGFGVHPVSSYLDPADIHKAAVLLQRIQQRLSASGVERPVHDDLKTLIGVLDSPVFRAIVTIQDSLRELRSQLHQHPSILPVDFDITESGELVLNIPPNSGGLYDHHSYDTEQGYEFDSVVPNISNREKTTSDTRSFEVSNSSLLPADYTPTTISTYPYTLEFQRAIGQATQGREVHTIQLYKPEGSSLGFSVVGLRSEHRGELGIFVQEIQPSGIAANDGQLQEGDQLLAIDGQPLDANISHQQAIAVLQQARGLVELVIARGGIPKAYNSPIASIDRSPSVVSDTSKVSDMVLNTEWAQVDAIDLVNDGTGLGFGIIGGRSTGVVVKTILPGGVADRDGRLQSGDHILQIGDVNLRGMGSEQVAAVLRQSGSHVRVVVARPIEPTSPDLQALQSHAPIVPTRLLGDAEELERHLASLQAQNGFANPAMNPGFNQQFVFDPLPASLEPTAAVTNIPRLAVSSDAGGMSVDVDDGDLSPETETFEVELLKDDQGLGITIAGYICEKDEISGIFVKSVTEGSAAFQDGRIRVNDQIVEVDNQSLQGYSNHQAVEVLRNTSKLVKLQLVRHLRGLKFEQLQVAIANSEMQPPAPISPAPASDPEALSAPNFDQVANSTEFEVENGSHIPFMDTNGYGGELDPIVESAIQEKWQKLVGLDYDIVVAQLSKFRQGGGLGISLEGTVDVEDGQEVRPHHYIRSILPDGPVGVNEKLRSGDELLEVNGIVLLGRNHVEVVSILKELPIHVRMVCARHIEEAVVPEPEEECQVPNSVYKSPDWLSDSNVNSTPVTTPVAASLTLGAYSGGSLQNLLPSKPDRLFKAKSDGSLVVVPSTGVSGADPSFSKLKSRSLEPLTGLAMWSSEPQIIELVKRDRGLGFSILDYQDPMNPNDTVIVIRSLVPGGVAQQDGRLIPGDRLMFVNDINLENASLDQAVQALKGASKGVVRIGVAKPLPLPESSHNGSQQLYRNSHWTHEVKSKLDKCLM